MAVAWERRLDALVYEEGRDPVGSRPVSAGWLDDAERHLITRHLVVLGGEMDPVARALERRRGQTLDL